MVNNFPGRSNKTNNSRLTVQFDDSNSQKSVKEIEVKSVWKFGKDYETKILTKRSRESTPTKVKRSCEFNQFSLFLDL